MTDNREILQREGGEMNNTGEKGSNQMRKEISGRGIGRESIRRGKTHKEEERGEGRIERMKSYRRGSRGWRRNPERGRKD